ncbi:hypothetical protein HBB16_19395 [Pseudonocardia sp. MCCB 268]|nr:hypothetical protein [Pseudonocardia cytotoxica]
MLTALDHALRSRQVRSRELIFHSDKGRGTRRCDSLQRLVDAGVAPSTSPQATDYDNAG